MLDCAEAFSRRSTIAADQEEQPECLSDNHRVMLVNRFFYSHL